MKRWPLNKAHPWETAPFLRILLPFIVGIICYDVFRPQRVMFFVSFAIASFALFSIFLFKRNNSLFYKTISFMILCCTLFCSGAVLSWVDDVRNNERWFGKTLSDRTSYLARITDEPVEKENSWKVSVSVVYSVNNGMTIPVTGDAFLYIYKDSLPVTFHKGDSILVPGNWQPIRNAGNPFEFDYAAYCRRNNIYLQQFLSSKKMHLFARNDPHHRPFIEQSHDWCMAQLDKYLADPKAKGLIQAMLLGDEVNLDEDIRQSYADTGIIHIIAISGGNVAIFFIVISFLLWWLKNKKHLWVKYTIALPLVWFYVLMAGAPPSAVRAAIMFSLLAFGVMLQKNNNSLNQLLATGFLLLCAQPGWLFSVGFQLSFVAVLSLILFYTPIYKWLSPAHKATQLLWGTVAASIAAEILVAPLVIYYFHTFPLLFVVANVIAYLFMSAVLVLSIAIIATFFLPSVASVIGIATTWLVTLFDTIVRWLQGLNPVSFHFLALTDMELILIYITIACMAVFLLKKHKPSIFASLCACILLLSLLCRDEWTSLNQQKLVIYNAGKRNHTELISGKAYSIIYSDAIISKKTIFATTPAHINLHAWRKVDTGVNRIFYINGKSILLLDEYIIPGSRFPVDYLVINAIRKPDPHVLQQMFSPSLMVIGNNYQRKQREKFKRRCMENGIHVHDLALDGALIID